MGEDRPDLEGSVIEGQLPLDLRRDLLLADAAKITC